MKKLTPELYQKIHMTLTRFTHISQLHAVKRTASRLGVSERTVRRVRRSNGTFGDYQRILKIDHRQTLPAIHYRAHPLATTARLVKPRPGILRRIKSIFTGRH